MLDAAGIHDLIARLAALDAVAGSGAAVDDAVVAFGRAARLVGADRDVRAAVAELGELTGWLLFDAERQAQARRTNRIALGLAEDPRLRWFILSNQALASVHTGRNREALRIADNAGPAAPRRVRALFDVRAARALAELGAAPEALRRFDRARSAFFDGLAPRDPAWTWWFDERELAGHHGLLHASLGNHDTAIPLLHRAVDGSAQRADLRWALYLYRVHLLRVLLDAGAWADAEPVAVALVPMVGTIAGARADKLLRGLAPAVGLPSTLGDALGEIRSRWSGQPRR